MDADNTILDENSAAAPSAPQPGATDASPASEQDAKPTPGSADDIVSQVAERQEETPDPSTEKPAAGETPKAEPEKKPEAKPDAKEEPVVTAKDKKKPSFQDHPDWIKREEKLKTVEKQVADLQTQVKAWSETQKWCQDRGIDNAAYQETLQVRADLASNDPKVAMAAVERAEQAIAEVKERLGIALPKDLQEAVDAAQITPEWAKQLASARVAERGSKAQVAQHQTLNAQQQEELIRGQIATWIESKHATNPSFAPTTTSEEGLFEDVARRMQTAAVAKINELRRPLSAPEMIALAESAYTGATKYSKRFTPAPRTIKPPLNGSSRNLPPATVKYDTDSIVNAVAARQGGGL